MTVRSGREPGLVLEVRLPDGTFAYGRNVNELETEFFTAHAPQPLDKTEVVTTPVLFRVVVADAALRAWKSIGTVSVDAARSIPAKYFRQDALRPDRYFIHVRDGPTNGMPAEREQCVGLERHAVWSKVHVEERLLNEFDGRHDTDVMRS